MSWFTKVRDFVTYPVVKPAEVVSKYTFEGLRKVTGSEKFSASIVSGGDPFNLFTSKNPETYGARNPTLFRKGVQAGRLASISVAAVVAGGLAASGTLVPTSTGAGTVVTEGGALVTSETAGYSGLEIEAAAGSGVAWSEPGAAAVSSEGIFTGAGATVYEGVKDALGLGVLYKSVFGTGVQALGQKTASYINEVFGGSATSPNTGGGGSMESGESGGMPGASLLPFAIIGLVLLYILTRKKRG